MSIHLTIRSVDATDLLRNMRRGNSIAWPMWDPEPLSADEVLDAWRGALGSRGDGVPETLQVYTHFPFCESSCNFCMYWHQVPKSGTRYDEYADRLVGLLETYGERLGRVSATNAYFGGGTPSAMPERPLGRYLEAFRQTFDVAGEFTCEGHPATMTAEKVALLAEHGVNRLSMGLQSTDPDVLRHITRRNPPLSRIAEIVRAARAGGMHVNMDLCLGLPGQGPDSFRRDLGRLMEVGPDIITIYRYQPVAKLPAEPGPEMALTRIFTRSLLARVAWSGYLPLAPRSSDEFGTRLLKPTRALARRAWQLGVSALRRKARSNSPHSKYGCFGTAPSQIIGIGSGAYSHIFGWGWFRDVTSTSVPGTTRYFGTRLTKRDECRERLLGAIDRGEAIDAAALEQDFGVALRDAFPNVLRELQRRATKDGGRVRFRPPPGDTELTELLMPELPPRRNLVAPRTADIQPELVALGRDPTGDRALVRSWCDALGISGAGRRFAGALVRRIDDRSVHFAVHGKTGPELRVFVRSPGEEASFASSRRFAISHGDRPEGPLTDAELSFLERLADATRQSDSAA